MQTVLFCVNVALFTGDVDFTIIMQLVHTGETSH